MLGQPRRGQRVERGAFLARSAGDGADRAAGIGYGQRVEPKAAVSVFTYRALKGAPITIWGDGRALRDYFYIGDMIPAVTAAMELKRLASKARMLSTPRGSLS